jgi:transmembrane sensor
MRQTNLRPIEAWQAGELDFDDVPLSEAVMEMNRYARTKLVIGDDKLNRLRISGIFRIGDVDDLVAGLTYAFPVRAVHREDTVLLLAADSAPN